MIPAHRLTTEPVVVRFAGSSWPLTLDMWAIAKLSQRVAPDDTGLEWLQPVMARAAAGEIDALAACLWAGLLRENPRLTFDETLSLLDEASMADLVGLPAQVLSALREAFGTAITDDEEDSGNRPWDWELALAAWIEQWGRSEAEFWQTTFRTFTSISNGLNRLYKASSEQKPTNAATGDGWTLDELMSMNRRGR